MAQQSARQRRTAGRVMHEFKHGELKRSQGGKGGKVKSRKQAIAIALKESGSSKYESKRANARNERKTERKEARGQTAQQARDGKAKVGASGRRESTRAMGGRNATKTTARRTTTRTKTTAARRRGGLTRRELYAKAQRKHIAGRSRMSKEQLKKALGL